MTMTWQNGRQLASLQKGVNTISYTYGEDGLRTKKSVNGFVSTYYRDDSGRLTGYTRATGTSHSMWFYYNPGSTTPDSLVFDGSRYLYRKNAQGDIIGILDASGNLVVRYVYDSWGNCVYVYDASGKVITDGNNIGNVNPLRYRGYEYDTETGFYYLQSRYYDPVTGRFVNADGIIGANNSLNTNNLFAYCGNNPVNKSDPNGMREVGCEFDERDQPLADIASKILAADEASNSISSSASKAANPSATGNIDTKSPPPPGTGYKPPKNPDKGKKRVPAPGGRGETGWLDKSGNVWVPDIDMDGGEGWRRHYPDGSHDHVYPGGKVRSHTFTWDTASQGSSSLSDEISAITGLTGTALMVYLIISEGSRVIPPRNLIPVP